MGETHSLTNGELAFLAIRHKAFLRLIRPEIPKQRRTFEAIWDVYFKEKEREKFPDELELKSFSVVTVFYGLLSLLASERYKIKSFSKCIAMKRDSVELLNERFISIERFLHANPCITTSHHFFSTQK